MVATRALCQAMTRGGGFRVAPPALPPPPRRGATSAAPAAAAEAATAATDPAVRPYSEIPGPKPMPVLGNMWRFIWGEWANRDFVDVHSDLRERYGKIVKIEKVNFGKDLVAIYDPVEVEKVYRNEGPTPKRDAFASLGYYRDVMYKDKFKGAAGLLHTNKDEWHDFRRRVQTPMLQPRQVTKYTAPIDLVASDFLDRLRELRDKDGMLPEDTVNWFFKWALESIAVIALDTRLGCLAGKNEALSSEPQKMIDAVQVVFEGLFELDLKPSAWRLFSTPMWRKYVAAVGVFEEVAAKYINAAMERMKKRVADGGEVGTTELSVLERLLVSNDDPRIASTMATDMLFGGIDTTSYATATLLYFLSRNQDKQERLYEELKRILPEKNTPVTPERLNEMKYLKAAIKESMRLKPVAIGQIRENVKDDLVLSNYQIKKGVDVVMLLSLISTSEEWFPEPKRFLPERWLKGQEIHGKTPPFTSLPFGFGPRMCIGRRFAELEIEVLNAKLLRNFRVEYPRKAKFETRLLHIMTSPLTFRLNDRD